MRESKIDRLPFRWIVVLFCACLISALGSILTVLQPLAAREAILAGWDQTLITICGLWILLLLGQLCCQASVGALEARLGAWIADHLSVQTLRKLTIDVNLSSRDVLSVMGAQIPLVERSYARCFTQAAASFSMLIAGFFAAQTVAGPAVAGILIFAITGILLGASLRSFVSKASSDSLSAKGDFVQLVHSGAMALGEIRYSCVSAYWRQVKILAKRNAALSSKAGALASAVAAASSCVVRSGSLVATVIGIYLVSHSQATAVDLATLLMLGGLIAGPFGAFASIGQDLSRCRQALQDIRCPTPAAPPLRFNGKFQLYPSISLERVSVSVEEDVLLDQINLKIDPGQKVALVGTSGSGKSTLLKLLSGNISNGEVSTEEDLYAYRMNHVAYVDQDCNLLPGQGKGEDIDGFELLQLPSELADRKICGSILSGGQRRRISVIRALSLGRPVLFLDEPTSGLDLNASRAIVEVIRSNSATVVVATHDEAVVSACSYVLYIKDRRICDSGNHSKLLIGNPEYRSLWMRSSCEIVN
ncbi:ATP-binding cassette domain-containing protein [Dermatophilus congolensis]|nr:ATP-binding cassette domain-containing protein [Dermatophilus congolensis]MBO3131299.1 ATP-binding cassette domain-containing protein [Dermatophilus congolensis]MBO3136782.1 ATP-binding cassette domain-containing protein [Dermatophilus congolensis]MBO3139026.1 ATP-binding cassette domain-containing protein [Dermatophilus congolensis]MBO3141260.1 ATP-binding cassette domain-containing protein [Dermatophilus congolensis]MBO3144699.1 ATP-binding cassette domain-containing protein [Dermatophilu